MKKEFQDIVSAKEAKACQSQQSLFSTATSGEFWKPFSCVGVILILFRLSSFSILAHYTAPFLDRAGISLDPLMVAVLIGIIRLIFSVVAFPIIFLISKRTTFILGGATSALGMFLGKSSIQKTTTDMQMNSVSYSVHPFYLPRMVNGQGLDTTPWFLYCDSLSFSCHGYHPCFIGRTFSH